MGSCAWRLSGGEQAVKKRWFSCPRYNVRLSFYSAKGSVFPSLVDFHRILLPRALALPETEVSEKIFKTTSCVQ